MPYHKYEVKSREFQQVRDSGESGGYRRRAKIIKTHIYRLDNILLYI